jgi:hypothetical protein
MEFKDNADAGQANSKPLQKCLRKVHEADSLDTFREARLIDRGETASSDR